MGRYSDEAIADMLGDDWEKWICPIKGPPGEDLCYVERESEECRKCEEEFVRVVEEQEDGRKSR